MIADVLGILADPGNWLIRVLQHLEITFVSLGLALFLALPLGLYVGETGRGGTSLVGFCNGMRALPTLGLVTFLFLLLYETYPAAIIGLVILAVPPILAGTYAGVQACDEDVADAAEGVGMSRLQRLWQVKIPIALPVLLGGIRNAVLQLVATATVAAYIGLGGLGRLLIDGLAVQDYPQMVAGAILTALLAIVLDFVFAGIQRAVVPAGVALTAAATAAQPGVEGR